MRVCVIGGVAVRVHPLLPFLLALYALLGQGAIMAAFAGALLLHEGGHIAAAKWLRIPITQVELTPFGGALQVDCLAALPARKVIPLCAAGPAVNLAFIPLIVIFILKFNIAKPYFTYFLLANALLLCVNMLPVLPLDGGRILLAALSHFLPRQRILRALLLLSRVCAAALVLYGAVSAARGRYLALPLITGFYLLYAITLEEKHGASRYLAALIGRRVRLDKRRALPVQTLCARQDMPLCALLPQLRAGAYHVVIVLDDDAQAPRGTLFEDALLRAALNAPASTLGALLRPAPR